MIQRPLPEAISEVTPAWLTAALADAPEWRGWTITTVACRRTGGGDSLASAVYLASLTAATGSGVFESAELLVKLHHPDPEQRSAGAHAAEALFYRELAARVSTIVPRTYVAGDDESDGRLVIVQEFLRDGRIGSADASLSVDEVERVLSSLATLHAVWWNSHELAGMSAVRAFEPVIRNAIANLRSGVLNVRRFLDRHGDLVDSVVAGFYATMPGWMEQVAGSFSSHATLIHLDCSAKNVFLPRDPRRAPVLFDWALFRRGNPALDVATLLVYSLAPEEHHRMPDLVGVYHEMLTARGVRDYPFERLWDDVRYGCLWRMAAPVFNASAGTPAREKHARTIIPLVDSAVFASGALDLLDPPRR